ncbi:hypothetical protein ADN00_07840 [Ornatilinea apprima]|uniref:Uncharacterized protein n=1 Tax=Ornatilinea apprima TaxID=1134406 RepID=A0A0P6X4Q7_9CHLR|nr:hypothetical protein [Ornatilinea apprima]KPL78079.1 hypothetical protein ADN00_07840 [Ornatilinea apprima]
MNKMKLGNFIAQTLTEIIDGVSIAQDYAKEKGACINPKYVKWSEIRGHYVDRVASGKDESPLLSPIEFEILLTVGEDDKAQGGLGIFASSLGIGIKGETNDYSETINRIKFQILAILPQQK